MERSVRTRGGDGVGRALRHAALGAVLGLFVGAGVARRYYRRRASEDEGWSRPEGTESLVYVWREKRCDDVSPPRR